MNAFKFRRVALAVFLLAGVAGDAWGQVQYTVTDLGSWQPSAINNLGQICGNQSDTLAILYSSGGTVALGTLDGWPYADAYALNDSGMVVGRSGVSNNEACSWSGTVAQDLGVHGKATSINNAGQIVGNYADNGAWLYSGGTLQSISVYPDPGSGWSITGAPYINNKSEILLNATFFGSPSLYVLANGTAEALNVGGTGFAMNDNGQFVGGTTPGRPALKAFHGTIVGPTVSELPSIPGYPNGAALALNDKGLIVGYYTDTAYGNLPSNAVLWDNDQVYDLNTLIEDSGWRLAEATGINDLGQICGYGVSPEGQTHAFLLTPVPEPSTVALLGVCVLALMSRALRHRPTRPQSGSQFEYHV